MAQFFLNNFSAPLDEDLADTDELMYLAAPEAVTLLYLVSGFAGDDYILMTLDDGTNQEIIKVTDGNDLGPYEFNIERALEGTTAQSFLAANTTVEARLTAGTLTAMQFDPRSILTAQGEVLVGHDGHVLLTEDPDTGFVDDGGLGPIGPAL